MTAKRKLPLRLKAYQVVTEALENGIAAGYRRAFKHTETPSEDAILDSIRNGVTLALEDVIDWEKSG